MRRLSLHRAHVGLSTRLPVAHHGFGRFSLALHFPGQANIALDLPGIRWPGVYVSSTPWLARGFILSGGHSNGRISTGARAGKDGGDVP